MSVRRYRPKRRLRSEALPLAAVFALALALYFAFPKGAVGFRPETREKSTGTYNAFIRLDAKTEAELLASARASWQSDSPGRRLVRADLLGNLDPSADFRMSSGLRPESRVVTDSVEEYELDFLPVGVAADPPSVLKADPPSVPERVFPDSDLLKLN